VKKISTKIFDEKLLFLSLEIKFKVQKRKSFNDPLIHWKYKNKKLSSKSMFRYLEGWEEKGSLTYAKIFFCTDLEINEIC